MACLVLKKWIAGNVAKRRWSEGTGDTVCSGADAVEDGNLSGIGQQGDGRTQDGVKEDTKKVLEYVEKE